jgi:hypothetical protein
LVRYEKVRFSNSHGCFHKAPLTFYLLNSFKLPKELLT